MNVSVHSPNRAGLYRIEKDLCRSEKAQLTIAATAAFAASATTAPTTAAGAPRLRFVDPNRPALDVSAVQAFDRAFRRFVGRHLDEAEPSRAVSRAVDDDLRAVHLSCF